MKEIILELKGRSEPLLYFTVFCFTASLLFLVLTRLTATQVAGVNAWYKPFKFALSIALYSGTMAWLVSYLPHFNKSLFVDTDSGTPWKTIL